MLHTDNNTLSILYNEQFKKPKAQEQAPQMMWERVFRKSFNNAILATIHTDFQYKVKDLKKSKFMKALFSCVELGKFSGVNAAIEGLENVVQKTTGKSKVLVLKILEEALLEWHDIRFILSDEEAQWKLNSINKNIKMLIMLCEVSDNKNIMAFMKKLSMEGFDEFVHSICLVNDLYCGQEIVVNNKVLIPGQSPKQMNKPSLVLDLDETLIHTESYFRGIVINSFDFKKTVEFAKDDFTTFYVNKRPYLNYFLKEMSKHFELIVWTAGEKNYANAIIDEIDPQGCISHRLYRRDCLKVDTSTYIKRLERLGRSPQKIAIIDNSCVSFALDLSNAIPIYPYRTGRMDVELLELIPFLLEMKKAPDFREFLESHFHLVGFLSKLQKYIQMAPKRVRKNK